MSIFGSWECPNCGSTWTGSIGWDFSILQDKDRLNRLLQTCCGCEPVDNPVYPECSCSFMNGIESDKRKELRGKKDVDST
jgi:hypothetical protein